MDHDRKALLDVLAKAGATVPAQAVAAWSPAQTEEAVRWALETIAAHAADPPGQHTSILWPEHVSKALYGRAWGRHLPTKRGR